MLPAWRGGVRVPAKAATEKQTARKPVLSLRYPANDGFDYLSHVREGIEHQEQSRFGWDGSTTYIDA